MIAFFVLGSMIMLTLPMGLAFASTGDVMSMRILGGDKYHFPTTALPWPLVTLTSAEKASDIWACAEIPAKTNSRPAIMLIRLPDFIDILPFPFLTDGFLSHQNG